MDAIGSQEVLLPIVQPAELWHESGRWNDYGPELARLKDRHDRDFCLGPTHEEIITALVRSDVRSYRELPLSLYQVNMKFRDEVRPRFGLLRGREFIMKDAYSFHADEASLQEHYDEQAGAYARICERLDLEFRPVVAESGQIGGKVTTEFMALAEAGEAALVYCDCGYAANVEAAETVVPRTPAVTEPRAVERIHTPEIRTIAELAELLGISAHDTVKTMAGKTEPTGRWSSSACPATASSIRSRPIGPIPGVDFSKRPTSPRSAFRRARSARSHRPPAPSSWPTARSRAMSRGVWAPTRTTIT